MISRQIGPLLPISFKPCSWYNHHYRCHHRLYTTSTEIQNNEIITSTEPTFHYAENQCTRYLKIRGPDTIPFLNGLCTSKLQPQITKKNLTTISPNDHFQFQETTTQKALKMLDDLDVRRGNWGIYKERGLLDHGPPFISRFGQYTGFLNSTGKLITDSYIYPTPVSSIGLSSSFSKYPEFLVGFDLGVYRRMVDYFRGHILTRRVKVEEVAPEATKTWDIMIGFGRDTRAGITINPWLENLLIPESSMRSPTEALEFADGVVAGMFPGHEANVLGVYPDTRSVGILQEDPLAPLSFRIVTDASVDDITAIFNVGVFPVPLEFKQVDPKFFRRSRLVNGFVDGVNDIGPESVLPLELNFDYYPNVVSVDKGCYVGQELLTRSFSTGILRKRSVPVKISNYKLLSEYLKLRPKDAKPLEVQMVDIQKQGQGDLDSGSSSSSNGTNNVENHYNPFSKENSSNNQANRRLVKKRRNRPVGTLLCAEDDIGLIRLRTEHFPRAFGDPELQGLFYIGLEDGGNRVELTPIRPFWLSEWLSEQHGIHT